METIFVLIVNFSSFDHVFEIFDVICNTSQTVRLDAWQPYEIEVCSSGATDKGYGHVQYNIDGSATWGEVSLLSDGDKVNMN